MSAAPHIPFSRLVAITAAACGLLLAAPAVAGAETYLVDSAGPGSAGTCTAAADDCTLADAIDAANADTGPDEIDFLALAITIDDPLPAVTDPVLIDAFGVAVTVSGTAAYTAGCSPSDFAFDLTAPAASGSTIRALPVYDVCNRAIKSNVPAPTIRIGPRRADNSVSITGQADAGATVDLYSADGAATGDSEADTALQISVASPAGAYSYTPGVEPVAGQKYTATQVTGAGSSNFATRAATPSDLASPVPLRAVGVSNSAVRLDFNEPLDPGSVTPQAFSLSVAGVPRTIVSATAVGHSVLLESTVPWHTGEAGSAALTGTTRVTDATGNEVVGQPVFDVAAGPGEALLPQITSMRASPNRFCKKVTRRCKRGRTTVIVMLNKPARVIFEVRRRGKRARTMVAFIRRLDAGRNRVRLTSVVSGRQLPRAVLVLRATAQDVARSLSPPAETLFRIVDNKRDL